MEQRKVVVINGSPRKRGNTSLLLAEAAKGAESVGAEVKSVNLYDLTYKGCISCLACKRKGRIPCHCYLKDDLSPVLEDVLQADVLLLGSLIYLGNVTGEMRCFLERLVFITLSYDNYFERIFQGHIDSAFFFTMNVGGDAVSAYEPMMKNASGMLDKLGGSTEYYAATNTLQFSDYSKYHAALFNEEEKRAHRETQFPKDLAKAFEIGARLAKGSV